MNQLTDLQDLLVDQLQDIYDAESQIVGALPRMAAAASSPDLKRAFETHLDETREHVTRLREVFRMLGLPARAKHCPAMAGLLAEGEDVLASRGNPDAIDAALIAAAQRVEHYEIAAYGTLKAFAKQLGHGSVVSLLEKSLDEEGGTDKKLTKIAEGSLMHQSINRRAAHA